MGIQKRTSGPGSGSTTPTSSTPSNNTSSNNNNSKAGVMPTVPSSVSQSPLSGFAAAVATMAAASGANVGAGEDGSNGFSSLMDIGAAYGIWNPEDSEFKAKRAKLEKEQGLALNAGLAGSKIDEKDDKEKLVIDEDEDDEEEEPLSPGGPEDGQVPPAISGSTEAVMDNEQSKPQSTTSTTTPMETSA